MANEQEALVVIPLANPIRAFDEEISEVRFRAPTGKDLIELGNPVSVNVYADDPIQTVKVDWAIMGRMMARLSGLPLSTIEAMAPNVLTKAATELSPAFFPVA